MKYTPAKQAVLDRLKFDPGPHRYTLDGMLIPSVTQVMEPHLPYAGLPKDVREAALLRGTLVHVLTEHYDARTFDSEMRALAKEAGLDGYIHAWGTYLNEHKVTILASEQRVYHTKYRYCGTLDRIVEEAFTPGIAELVDIKTGELSPFYAWQTAAYCAAVSEGGITIPRRACVQLKADGTYRHHLYTAPEDWPAFLGALKVAEWRFKYA